jgi:hypothetical protein
MNRELILVILIIIFLIFVVLIIIKSPTEQYYINKSKKYEIPKKIWTYWDTEDLPETIQKCINNWHKLNPEYDIIVLNNQNYKSYIKNCDILSYPACRFVQRISDFIRIHTLNQNGGIWIDASTILHSNLDWVIDKYNEGKYEYIGFNIESKETKPEYPVIENWFMAAPAGSKFIQSWLEIFLKLNDFNTDIDYLTYIESLGIDLQNLSKSGYLAMHYAVQYVLQKLMTIDEIKRKLYLEKAEDGPFKYLHVNKWDLKKSIEDLCVNKDLQTKVVKFRGAERKVIEDNKLICVFNTI